MKAIRLHAPGGPEQVVYEDAPIPTLQPGDALVRVLASGTTRSAILPLGQAKKVFDMAFTAANTARSSCR